MLYVHTGSPTMWYVGTDAQPARVRARSIRKIGLGSGAGQ